MTVRARMFKVFFGTCLAAVLMTTVACSQEGISGQSVDQSPTSQNVEANGDAGGQSADVAPSTSADEQQAASSPVSPEQQAAQDARDEEIREFLEDPTATQTPVPLGSTMISTEGDWQGEMGVTVRSAAVFNTVDEAATQYDLGNIRMEKPGEAFKLLVMEIDLQNISASPTDAQYGMFLGTLFVTNGVSLLASFDGGPEDTGGNDDLAYRYAVASGETATVRVGRWIPADTDLSTLYMVLQKAAPERAIYDLGLA